MQLGRIYLIVAMLVVSLSAAPTYGQAIVGKASLYIPAVILANNSGQLTTVNLVVQRGDGKVVVNGPAIVGESTVQSAVVAAQYASGYMGVNFSSYNFTYTITDSAANVSGPSGGAALTLLAISALSGTPLLTNFTITGTISPNGQIGQIGGAYDKAGAAKAAGLSFILVPAAGADTVEAQLYLLTQDTFNIPLIQVANISAATRFAFHKTNILANKTTLNLSQDINVAAIGAAPLQCSNSCDLATFGKLVNFTFQMANGSLATLSADPTFSGPASQLSASLVQDVQVGQKGYLYAAADLAFLNYVDSFYFNSHSVSKPIGLSTLISVNNYCNSLSIPQMTPSNYEYVIAGELRQSWAEYTLNTTIAFYNATNQTATTDDVLLDMRQAATSNGWCRAAAEMYALSGSGGSQPVAPSLNLQSTAYARITSAAKYGNNLYLATAREALQANNYPLAILDADYAYALNAAPSNYTNMTNAQMLSSAAALARNSTYGAWATEFGNEAEFYISESRLATNASSAKFYAQEAYSSALLASQISQDTALISANLSPGQSVQHINNTTSPSGQGGAQQASVSPSLQQYIDNIYTIVLIISGINLIVLIIVLVVVSGMVKMLKSWHTHPETPAPPRRRGNARARK